MTLIFGAVGANRLMSCAPAYTLCCAGVTASDGGTALVSSLHLDGQKQGALTVDGKQKVAGDKCYRPIKTCPTGYVPYTVEVGTMHLCVRPDDFRVDSNAVAGTPDPDEDTQDLEVDASWHGGITEDA